MRFAFFAWDTGLFEGPIIDRPDNAGYPALPAGCGVWAFDGDAPDRLRYRVQDALLVEYQPDKPADSPDLAWAWNADVWRWVSQPTLGALVRRMQAQVDVQVELRTAAPIWFDGALFDADATSRGRISGLLQQLVLGLGLPAGWVGWRDADNAMHWSAASADDVRASLAALARAISDREQALLCAAWRHKTALGMLTTIDDVLAYSLTAGWP
jgi:hypothetical protein